MASAMKDKLSKMTSSSSASTSETSTKEYSVKVTASTSYESTHGNTVIVNGPDCTLGDSTRAAVRIKEFRGIPEQFVASSDYFKDPAHTKDTYSIAFSWIPEHDVSAQDLVWGIELINPIRDRIPGKFITTAFEVCKRFVDSSLSCDPDADQPWVNGAILCGSAMTWSVGSKSHQAAPVSEVLSEGGYGDGDEVREKYGIPSDENKRRKYFGSETKRKEFIFEKGRCYQFDFHNGYIDWKDYALKLPGFSLGVLKWINDRTHTLRFVMKNRSTGQPYLVVTVRLMFGEELDRETAAAARSGEGPEPTQHTPLERQTACDVPTTAGQTDNDSGRAAEVYIGPAPPEAEAEIEGDPSAELPAEADAEEKSKEVPAVEAPSLEVDDDVLKRTSSSEPTRIAERLESTTIQEESSSASSPESRGYKHSIEESLCSTASVDARGKSVHMFE